jgi:Aerotolerance regulator N-terminal/von Willebrand factor type A domain/CARDB
MFPWWTSLTSGLSSWLVNPGLFLAGALLVSVPIIIHLLNRRKFKIVDWAAMDFLLEADKKNRRRVRLENWLLLLLRCLAILILGLLLARPYDSSGLSAKLLNAQRFERILLIDDSLSMKARIGNRTAMEIAIDRATELANQFANEPSENAVTLILTSQPEQRSLNATPISKNKADDVIAEISEITAGDQPARLENSLQELETYLASQPANVNRIVYILSDLRRQDWSDAAEGANPETEPQALLRKIAKHAKGTFVIDVADEEDRNLLVKEIIPEKTLVAGVESRFEVQIQNAGQQDAANVKVKFTAGEAVPITQTIDKLPAGDTVPLQFSVLFAAPEEGEEAEDPLRSRTIKVELQAEKGGEEDRLQEDSFGYLAARVIPGIPTLLVDGDPSASFGKSETFYLKRALRPAGKTNSGIAPEVVTDNELETLDLSKYQVIFLCNLYRLSEKPLQDLKKWVEAGGGLVIFPGNQVDEEHFNENFFGTAEETGKLLSPIRLESIQGDETEGAWNHFQIADEQHPILADFAGQQNPLLAGVKIFRWWKLTAPIVAGQAPPQILARFNDSEESPALVERPLGKGRVIVSGVPADADWTNWTSDPSYILTMQLLVRYLTPGDARESMLRVGEPLRKMIDLTQFDLDAELLQPGGKKVNLQAVQLAGAEANQWLLEQKQARLQGLYELKLSKRGGGVEPLLFAANVDPLEGNLKRANVAEMKRTLRDAGVEFVSGTSPGMGNIGAQVEIWKYLLWLLIGLLLAEQALGWLFGLRR